MTWRRVGNDRACVWPRGADEPVLCDRLPDGIGGASRGHRSADVGLANRERDLYFSSPIASCALLVDRAMSPRLHATSASLINFRTLSKRAFSSALDEIALDA